MSTHTAPRPLIFNIVKWYIYFFAGAFALYGGVKIILSFLDRTYADIQQSALFLAVGILMAILAVAFRDLRAWSWYAWVAINGIVVLLAILSFPSGSTLDKNPELMQQVVIPNVVLLILSLAALGALMVPGIRNYIFRHR